MQLRKHLSVVVALGLSATALAAAPAARADTHPAGSLWVSGNKIVDGTLETDGATLKARVLRGIHREGSQQSNAWFPDSTELGWIGKAHPTGASRSWNSSLVRVPVGSAQWTGACPNLATNYTPAQYQAKVDDEIDAITSQGIVALLDLHMSTGGCTGIGGHAMPDYDVTLQFWQSAAAHYASNPLVAFELYNEPHFVTSDTWLNGTTGATIDDCDIVYPDHNAVQQALETQNHNDCEKKNTQRPYRAIGMQQLADVVWAAAPNHLIVVDGPGRALTVPSVTLADAHNEIAYAVHPYTCGDPNTCQTALQNHANNTVLQNWQSFGTGHPVLVTEFGWPVYKSTGSSYRDGATFYSQTLAFLNQQTPAWGFAAFAFDGGLYGAYDMVTNLNSYAPNSTAQPVYDLLTQS